MKLVADKKGAKKPVPARSPKQVSGSLSMCVTSLILDASVVGLFIVVFLCPRRPQWTLFYGKDVVPFFAMVLVSVCDPVSAMSEFPEELLLGVAPSQ